MIQNLFKKINRPIFISELSSNHNGSISNAKKIIKLSKKYGADYIKLQTYSPDTITLNSKKKDFLLKKGEWKGNYLWNLYKKAHTPFQWHKDLFEYSKKIGIKCFSSPFDETAVDLLEKLKTPLYKIASFEITHLPLIKEVALTKKPVIISTGMASLEEIEKAFNLVSKYHDKIILLYCVSSYPANEIEFDLSNIQFLKKRFKCPVGFSDHSLNSNVAKQAALLGAEIFEKHVAIKNVKGPDYNFSLKESEIKDYITDINNSYKIKNNNKFISKKSSFYKNYRRSIYSSKRIKKGELFSQNNIKVVRPAKGIEPKYFTKLIGKKSPLNIDFATPINMKILKKLIKAK
jgi:pseudaminic acid synthase